MIRMIHILLCVVSLMCLLISAPAARADDNAVLKNIRLANTRDDLIAYFEVDGAFTSKINQAVLNGIPTTFSFYIYLYHDQETWFDTKIGDVEFKSTVQYNTLKKEFTVYRPWKPGKPVVTKSFNEAKLLMTRINNVRVARISDVIKGEKYQIRIKAELDKVTLPLYLHYVLFFVSYWDFETDWYLINFIY
ncbi:MAG: DUF4390 domain-containing protein [Desulfobacteraceae bacterium]|nr:MAG: DUF4390 domain-containing protein [Desulfobacteraceae bacterium]